MRRALDAARNGEGTLALVAGEAGIGKTTLVRRVAQEARQRGFLVLTGQCYDFEPTPPYGPWREMLRAAAAVDGLPPLPAGFGPEPGAATLAGPDELHAVVGRYLTDLAARAPVLLIVDDAHWADQASLDLVRTLGRRLEAAPILLLVTYRDREPGADQPLARLLPTLVRESRPLRIRVQPLESPDVAELIGARYGLAAEARIRLVDYLMTRTEGNPFFIEEVLVHLEDERVVRPAGDGWTVGDLTTASVPPLLRQVIAGRLERTAERTRRLLHVAAVIGSEVPLALWQEVVDEPPAVMAAALEEALAAQILTEGADPATVRFRHALIHQALYEGLALPRRGAWHRRLGEVLANRAGVDPGGPADHFWRANDQRAIPWLVRGGDRARDLYAPAAAVDYYSRAFDLAAAFSIEVPAAARLARGQAYATLGEFDQARDDFTAALAAARVAADRVAEWRVLIALGELWSGHDYTRAGEYFTSALSLARDLGDRSLLARSLTWVGNWRLYIGHAKQAVTHHEQALAVFEELADQEEIAETTDKLTLDYLIRGDMTRAAIFGRRTVAVADAVGQQHLAASTLKALASTDGLYEFAVDLPLDPLDPLAVDCRRFAEQSIALAARISWRSEEALARCVFASYLGLRGEYGPALAQARRALAIAREINHRDWEVLARTMLGYILLDLLARDEAEYHLMAAAERTGGLNSFLHVRLCAAPLAVAVAATGDHERARAILDPVLGDLASIETTLERRCWWARGEVALTAGDPATALDIADHLIGMTTHGTPERIPPPLGCLRAGALLALDRADEVEPTLDAAERVAVRSGLRSLHWRILALREETLVRQHRQEESRHVRQQWQALIDELATTIADDHLRTQFRDRALTGARATPDLRPAGLSPRELEVLRLAARGLTNEAIADQLYISPRTVKGHLQSIYTKLDVTSRTAATAVAFAQGLV